MCSMLCLLAPYVSLIVLLISDFNVSAVVESDVGIGEGRGNILHTGIMEQLPVRLGKKVACDGYNCLYF